MESFFQGRFPTLLESAVENPLVSAGLISIVIGTIYAIHTLRTWMRLRHIKGPPLAGFSNLWLVRVIMGGNTHWELGHTNEKYGEFTSMPPVWWEPILTTHLSNPT